MLCKVDVDNSSSLDLMNFHVPVCQKFLAETLGSICSVLSDVAPVDGQPLFALSPMFTPIFEFLHKYTCFFDIALSPLNETSS